MASHSSDQDPEAVFPEDTKASKFSQGARPFFEAAALLSVWSVLVIGEGVVRFINSDPSQNLFANVPLPPIVPFLGGLFEVAFGIAGLIVGLSALIFNDHDPRATKMVMIFQSVTGFYVLAVFVFAMPALRASGLTEGILPGLSLNASRAVITFGILTSLSWCFALQGGQFLFMARLIAGATGTNFMGHGKGSRMRALFWNTNFALSGLWTLVTGILLTSQFGARPLSKPFVAPPNVGLWPVMTLFTGALMLGWGLLGNFLSISGKRGPMRSYVKVTAAVYLWVLCNYSIVQLGAIPGEPRPAAGGALHAGLVFMVMFLGPYFMVKQVEEQEVQA